MNIQESLKNVTITNNELTIEKIVCETYNKNELEIIKNSFINRQSDLKKNENNLIAESEKLQKKLEEVDSYILMLEKEELKDDQQ